MWITRVIAAGAIALGLCGAAQAAPMSPIGQAVGDAHSDSALLQLVAGPPPGWGPPVAPPGGWGPAPRNWRGVPNWCTRSWKYGWVRGYGNVWYRYVGPYCRLQVAPAQRAPGIGGCIQVGPSTICGGVPF